MNQSYSNKRNGEIAIDLKELIWRLLEQWKAIIVCALVVMLLFSSAMYLRSSGSSEPAGSNAPGSGQNDVLASLSAEDRATLMGVYREKVELQKVQNYINESPFMSIDPYNVNTFTSKWLINSDESINKQLVSAFISSLTSGETAETINEQWGSVYKTDQVKDLLTATSDIPVSAEYDFNENILTFSVYIPEGMDESVISDAVNEIISETSNELSAAIGNHSIKNLTEEITTVSDSHLAENQFNVINRFYNLKLQVNTLTNYLTADQKIQLNSLVQQGGVIKEDAEEETEAIEPAETVPQNKRGSFFTKKNALVGFALGLIAYVGIYVLYFIFSGKIVSSLILEDTFGLNILGELHKNTKDFLRSDRFVFKKHHKGRMNRESELDRTSESLNSLSAINGYKNLLIITRDSDNEDYKDYIAELKNKIGDNYSSVNTAAVNTKEGVYLKETDLMKNDAILLLADLNKTGIKDVKEVCHKAETCGTPFLGAICLGY